jgi:hypothetical protein
MAGRGPWRCNRCLKKFADPAPVRQHIQHVHKGVGEPERVPKSAKRLREEAEGPSMADRAIDAELDRAMGVYNPDAEWLLP